MKNLIESYHRILSAAHSNHLAALSENFKISCFHPTVLQQSRITKTPYIAAESPIRAYNGIFMISTEESITSQQFVGASNYDTLKLNQSFNKVLAMHEIMEGQQIQGVFKMLIQIYANEAETTGKDMPLRTFCSHILRHKDQSLDLCQYASKTLSPYLRNVIMANNQLLKQFQAIINQHFVRFESEQQFNNIFNYCRKASRRLSPNSQSAGSSQQGFVDFIAPVIPQIRQSFSPNCQITGKYFPHLRSSVYYVESVRQIEAGEQLSVGYRRGLNNYDMLIRYNQLPFDESGSQLRYIQNPNSEYVLFIDLMKTNSQIFADKANQKMQVLRENGLKMKNAVKIGKKGRVNAQDMMMLRVLFTAESHDPTSDPQIHQTLCHAVTHHLAMNLDLAKIKNPISPSTDGVMESIRVIQLEEKQILQGFLRAHQGTRQ